MMAIRVLQQISLNTKSDSNILAKSFYFSHCISSVYHHDINRNCLCDNKVSIEKFSNEYRILKNPIFSFNPPLHTKLSGGSLLCNNKTALTKIISTNNHPTDVNSIRHYATSPPVILNDAIAYNTGFLKIMSESLPVELVTELLRLTHYQVGIPWWLTIILTTVATRVLIHFPLTVLDLQNRAKRKNLKSELEAVAEHLRVKLRMEMQVTDLTSKQAAIHFKQAMAKEQKELFVRENCHPFKSIVILLIQAPVWITFTVAVRNICFMLPHRNSDTVQDYIGLVNGGFGWIQNLAQADPMFVLPIAFGLCGLTILEINDLLFHTTKLRANKTFKNVYRVMTVIFIPITACVPSAMSLHWVTNNFCVLAQNTILLSPKVRRALRIKDSDIQHPYTELANRMLGRFRSSKLSAKA